MTNTAELYADAANPRKITQEEANGLSASLAEFGDLAGITFNTKTGELVTGHQRLTQIRERWGELPIEPIADDRGVIRAPVGDFPVRFVAWSKAKQRAANVAANSSRIAGAFTDELGEYLLAIADEYNAEAPGVLEDVRLLDLISTPEGDAQPQELPAMYQVICECASEAKQQEIFELVKSKGATAKCLTM